MLELIFFITVLGFIALFGATFAGVLGAMLLGGVIVLMLGVIGSLIAYLPWIILLCIGVFIYKQLDKPKEF